MKVKWLGDDDLSHTETEAHGFTFPKGEFVTVPDNHPKAAILKTHPRFEVKGAPKVADPVDTIDPPSTADLLEG